MITDKIDSWLLTKNNFYYYFLSMWICMFWVSVIMGYLYGDIFVLSGLIVLPIFGIFLITSNHNYYNMKFVPDGSEYEINGGND